MLRSLATAFLALALALASCGADAQEAGPPQRDPCALKGKTWAFTWDGGARILAGPFPERWILEGAVVASPGSEVQGSWQRVDQARAAMAAFVSGLREPRDVVEDVTPVLAGEAWRAPLAQQPEIRLGVTARTGQTDLLPEHVSIGLVESETGERTFDSAGRALFEVRISPEAGISVSDTVRVTYKVFDAARWLKLGPESLRLLCQGDAAGFDAAKRAEAQRINEAREQCFACRADLKRPNPKHERGCWLASAVAADADDVSPR